jgi:trypsin
MKIAGIPFLLFFVSFSSLPIDARLGSSRGDRRGSLSPRKREHQTSTTDYLQKVYDWLQQTLTNPESPTEASNSLSPSNPEDSPLFGKPVSVNPPTANDTTTDKTEQSYAKQGRIVGGSSASATEAPFFAMLLTWNDVKNEWEDMGCGGTVISKSHILTAAHCLMGRSAVKGGVYVGAYRPFNGNANVPFLISAAKKYTLHPSFDDNTNYSDLAIITLATPITDSTIFPPIRLLKPNQSGDNNSLQVADGDAVRIYGFGQLGQDNLSSVTSLQVATTAFLSNGECKQYYPRRLLADMVCGGSHQYADPRLRTDACFGDSGGVMAIKDGNQQMYQIGIVSWGDGCAIKPGVYTSVQYHYDWIQATVCAASVLDDSNGSLCAEYFKGTNLPTTTVSTSVSTQIPIQTARSSGAEWEKTKCGTRKVGGDTCNYGGECCSGVCKIYVSSGGMSATTNMRMCQAYTTTNSNSRASNPSSSNNTVSNIFSRVARNGYSL